MSLASESSIDIAFYIGQLGGGGAERVVAALANEFSKRGFAILVIANYFTEEEYSLLSSIEKVYLETGFEKRGFFTRNAARIGSLRRLCTKRRVKNLICFMAEPNFRGLAATFGTQTRVFLSVRNDPSKEYPGRSLDLAKLVFPYADRIVFQTHEAQAVFPEKVRCKSRIIANPVDDAFFFVVPDYSSQLIVTAGRLAPQKNFTLLIEAFSLLIEEFPAIELEIYGDGEDAKKLQDSITKLNLTGHVQLMGRSVDMPSVYSKAGIFVMSSNFEGMPNALMEAQAVGLPVISTDCPCGGPCELIDEGKSGMLVPVGDAGALASAISLLLRTPELRSKLGAGARESASRYHVSLVADVWLDMLKEG